MPHARILHCKALSLMAICKWRFAISTQACGPPAPPVSVSTLCPFYQPVSSCLELAHSASSFFSFSFFSLCATPSPRYKAAVALWVQSGQLSVQDPGMGHQEYPFLCGIPITSPFPHCLAFLSTLKESHSCSRSTIPRCKTLGLLYLLYVLVLMFQMRTMVKPGPQPVWNSSSINQWLSSRPSWLQPFPLEHC